jgi:GAF domain-containing protein/HAMP domain-containing protein
MTQPTSIPATKENHRNPSSRPFQVTLATVSIISFLALGGYLALFLNTRQWQVLLPAIMFFGVFGVSLYGLEQIHRNRFTLAPLWWEGVFLGLGFLVQAMFIKNTGLTSALIYLVYILLLSSILREYRQNSLVILAGLSVSAFISLGGVYSPFISIEAPIVNSVLSAFFVLFLGTYAIFILFNVIASTMQLRLTTAFITIAIASLLVATIVLTQVSIQQQRQSVRANVVSSAEQVADNIDHFLKTNLRAVQQEAQLTPIVNFLNIYTHGRIDTRLESEVRSVFKTLLNSETNERIYLTSYALLDTSGKNLIDTTDANEGRLESDQPYFKVPIKNGRAYVSDVVFDPTGGTFIYISAPVRNTKNQIVGVYRIRFNALIFQRMLETYSGLLGIRSHAMLFDEYTIRLADTFTPNLVYTTVTGLQAAQIETLVAENRLPNRQNAIQGTGQTDLAQALQNPNPAFSFESNLEPESKPDPWVEIGGVASMTEKPWKVVYIQADFNDATIRDPQIRVATLVATILSLIVGFISVGVSNYLSAPITSLTRTAQKISQGDLETRTNILGADEFGTLGRAFNQMADQLRAFITDLENRVAERTREISQRNEALTYRSRQLQTVAEVARSIVTSQDLQPLLNSITQLISERFGFYHVGIFLLDEAREFAVLRAANSEGGQRMLARRHRLGVGKTGIVGYVTGTGNPRIATDVGEDSVFFNNPDLPLTRSEMALPLKVNEEVIGALDIQSVEPNAFSHEDIELFSTLADQIAVAIYNNRLYTETARALAEAENIHRQYLRQEWETHLTRQKIHAYQYTPQGLTPVESEPLPQTLTLYGDEPLVLKEQLPDQTTRTILAVPISVRGEIIGVIRVEDSAERQSWSEDELQAVREVAQQVGIALEAARLLERTVQRAEREKKVLEITGKIRATNDPQEMLEIAAAELQKALGASHTQIFVRNADQPVPGDGNGRGPHGKNEI